MDHLSIHYPLHYLMHKRLIIMSLSETPSILAALESLLRRHDWFFEYSDDHRVWRKYHDIKQSIYAALDIAHKLGWSVEANKLYHQYCPWETA